MISLNNLLQWYRSQIPSLIQLMSEEGVISQLKDINNLPSNLLDLYFQYRSRYQEWLTWDIAQIRTDVLSRMDTDYYTPLFLVFLFQHSDISTTDAIPRLQFSMSYVPDVVDKSIFHKVMQIINQRAINLELPFWMVMIKNHAYLNDLYIANQFVDAGWLIGDDDEQATVVEDMDSSTYLSMDQQTVWGYYLPQQLLAVTDISEAARFKRHNIIVYEFAKKCAQRKLWDLSYYALRANPTWDTSPKMGKIAAQMLFQSLLWCRLNYVRGMGMRSPSTLMGMLSQDDAEFIPFMYAPTGTGARMIPVYELKTCRRISQWARQTTEMKPYLGDGSLVSRVTLEVVSPGAGQDQIVSDMYDNRFVYNLSYHMSAGFVPYWMSNYLRSLTRPQSPLLDTAYAGLIDVGPIVQNFNSISRNLKQFVELYVPVSPSVFWSPHPDGYPNTLYLSNIKGITSGTYGPLNDPISDSDGAPYVGNFITRLIYPNLKTDLTSYPDCCMFSGCPLHPATSPSQYATPIVLPSGVR